MMKLQISFHVEQIYIICIRIEMSAIVKKTDICKQNGIGNYFKFMQNKYVKKKRVENSKVK